MTTSKMLAIPAAVLGNSPHTVRLVGISSRDEEGGVPSADHLAYYRERHQSLGYTIDEKVYTDTDGVLTTDTTFRQNGEERWRFRTKHYTRVDCRWCSIRWARRYVAVEQDGQMTEPEPMCDNHIRMTRERVQRAINAGWDMAIHVSDVLHIGQH